MIGGLLLVCQGWAGADAAQQLADAMEVPVGAYRPEGESDLLEAALADREPEQAAAGWKLYRVDLDVVRAALPHVSGLRRIHLERLARDLAAHAAGCFSPLRDA